MLYHGLTVLVAFAVSVVGTRWFIDWLADRSLVAVENNRTMHTGAVPQGGGAPVMLAVIVATALTSKVDDRVLVLLVVAAGLTALSAANDRRDIAFPVRLVAHFAAGVVALVWVLSADGLVFGGVLPFVLDRLITLVALVWFMNLYNFMDGIDGIAGVETIALAAGCFALLGGMPFGGLELALMGAAAGFLVWNWHKARIFLGDVGSIPLGFLLGVLLIHLAMTQSLAAAVVLPLYYLVDATWTLVVRIARGERPWDAHREHAYQRAARALGSHSAVVMRVAACNVVLIGAAFVAVTLPVVGLGIGICAVALLLFWLEQAAARGTGVTAA
jgi:UDP-N-acetylmuramyl pentapeptide phosphotransferase/UDP-N-acetylglucosamine-1-phosphate transferase